MEEPGEAGPGVVEQYVDLGRRVLATTPRLGPVRLVAVDGRAGAGKSSFAAGLAAALAELGVPAPVVHTDDLLDGWAGIETYRQRLESWVLGPLRRGQPGRYQRYDWHAGRLDPNWHTVPVTPVVVVEGVTAARAAGSEASLRVFVVAPREVRYARWLARDGQQSADHARAWMREEDELLAAHPDASSADLLVDGDPAVRHDRSRCYVRMLDTDIVDRG